MFARYIESKLGRDLVAQLLTQLGQQIVATAAGPMNGLAQMRGGGKYTREIPLMGGERFRVVGASPIDSPGKGQLPIRLNLKPDMLEEYAHLVHVPMRAAYRSEVVFTLVDTQSGEPMSGLEDVDLPTVVDALIRQPAMLSGKTWEQVIDAALAKEHKKEVAQRLESHNDFGSW